MAVNSQDGVTTLTPTAWKWFTGAAFIFFLIPPFGILIAVVFILTGAGVLQRLTLSPDGLSVRNWWSTKTYAWSEIGDFRVHTVKSGLFTAANMVSFTQTGKDDSVMGKASKFLVGGTDTVPAVGMKAGKLVLLMQAYKQGFAPQSASFPVAKSSPVSALPVKPATPKRPRAVPATPRAQRMRHTAKPKLGSKSSSSTPLVQDGGSLFGRRRPDSPFGS
ncbi:MAG: PH domain-containing protein [Hyphomonadaceae bacterium]|nr:PH domain-containing protein [Hyphomonadaceae bacterium]